MLTRTARRYVIALSIVVLLVALYAVAGFWAVPHFLRSGVSDFVSSHYKRRVAIGDIRFNPFTFKLDISDFSLPDRDGRPMLGFGRLHVDLELVSLFKLGPSFREIELERPLIRTVVRPDGTLNLADLGKGFESKTPPPPKPSEPMRLFIDRFAVLAGAGTFEDLSHPTPFRAEFKPITFELHNFSTRAKPGTNDHNEYSLTAASPQGERLEWTGEFLLEPVSSHGTFAVTDLHADTIWNYLQKPLPLEIPSGVIAVKGEYDFNVAGNTPALKVDVHDTTVSDLKLRPRQGTTDYIALGKLDVRETKVDLAKHAVEVEKVSLTGGEVNAWLSPQGQLNLLELTAKTGATADTSALTGASVPAAGGAVAPAGAADSGAAAASAQGASASSAPAAGGSAAPAGAVGPSTAVASAPGTGASAAGGSSAPAATPAWTVSVPDISVDGLKISAEDRQVTPALAVVLSPLNIHVAGYNTTPQAQLDVTAHTSINDSATVNATAKLAANGSGDATAHVELAKLDLSLFQPFIAQRTAMTLQAGQLTTQLDVQKSAEGAISVKGDVDVAGLKSVDELQQSFIRWKDLRVAGIQYNSQPASLRIASITARQPYARVIIAPDRTVNVEEVLAGPSKGTPSLATRLGAANAKAKASGITSTAAAEAANAKEQEKEKPKEKEKSKEKTPPEPPAPAQPVIPMSIGIVRVIDASANYADFWIQPNFAVGIQTLNGTVEGLSSEPKSRAKVKLDGKVDRYAPVNIDGEVNLLSASAYSDIKMSFKGLELTTMTPYSGRFAGYKIDKGKLSVDVSYKIEERKLTAEQHFVIDQLQLGEKVDSPDAVHLPLKLAVALLKDRNGVIDLPLPITGSLDDPQFKVGPIIWHAVLNLLEKVATAPFAALGHLFGGHGEEMKFIDFTAGSADLDDASKQKLTELSKALQDRTQLQLDVPIVYSKDLDGPVLAKKRLDQTLTARAKGQATALTDHQQHYRLLLAEYQADFGKDADLPASTLAIQNAKSKKDAPPVETAIPDLETALVGKIAVPDVDLQDLGKKRTRAIQDALLADGGIDASRVFIINGPAKTDDNGKVRVEMALK